MDMRHLSKGLIKMQRFFILISFKIFFFLRVLRNRIATILMFHDTQTQEPIAALFALKYFLFFKTIIVYITLIWITPFFVKSFKTKHDLRKHTKFSKCRDPVSFIVFLIKLYFFLTQIKF